MPLKETLSRNLKAIRVTQQLSLTAFAQKLDIGRSTLCSLEAGRLNTTLDMVEQIANLLHVTPLQLLSDTPTAADADAIGIVLFDRDELEKMTPERRAQICLQLQTLICKLGPDKDMP